MRNSKILVGVTLATPVLLADEASGASAAPAAGVVSEAGVDRAQAQVRLKRTLLKLGLSAKVRIAGDRLPPLRNAEPCQTARPSTNQGFTLEGCASAGAACVQGQSPQVAISAGTQCPTFVGCTQPEEQTPPAAAGDEAVIYTGACTAVQPQRGIGHTMTCLGCNRTADEAVVNTAACAEPAQPRPDANTYTSILCPRRTGEEAVINTALCSEAPATEEQPEVQPPPTPAPRARRSRTPPATAGCQ